MKRSDSMLRRVEDYLRYRHALGYALRIEGGMLVNFARFADKDGRRGPLTCDLATRWARLPATSDRLYWARRIEVLIGFARYCKIFDSQTEIPPRHVFGPAHRRKTPYIYSCRQLEELVFAARQLTWDGKMHTYATLFGLLACTGLRISEALSLRSDQVDLKQGILTIKESKRRRFRLVPLHPSAVPPLEEYAAKRIKRFPEATFFFVNRWLFFGDADAGERSAVIYSIIESCRRHDVALHLYARHPQSLALTDQSSNQGHRSKSLGRSNKKCCSSSSVNTANVVTQNYDLLSSLQSIGYSKVPGVTLTQIPP
jgi:integrase